MRSRLAISILCLTFVLASGLAEDNNKSPPVADPALAKKLGADKRGMRKFILVILKTGPKRTPDGPARDEMFKGHMANIKRLADAGTLTVAGPFEEKSDWRGMFILAVETQEDAKKLVETDPVIKSGEMVADYHTLYASAALMGVKDIHDKIAPK